MEDILASYFLIAHSDYVLGFTVYSYKYKENHMFPNDTK